MQAALGSGAAAEAAATAAYAAMQRDLQHTGSVRQHFTARESIFANAPGAHRVLLLTHTQR